MAFDTVSFTYGIFQSYFQIPQLATMELKKAAVGQLRTALKAKNFLALPIALKNRLLALEGKSPPPAPGTAPAVPAAPGTAPAVPAAPGIVPATPGTAAPAHAPA